MICIECCIFCIESVVMCYNLLFFGYYTIESLIQYIDDKVWSDDFKSRRCI